MKLLLVSLFLVFLFPLCVFAGEPVCIPGAGDQATQVCVAKNVGGYPSSVALIFPAGLNRNLPIDWVIHFHGNTEVSKVETILENYQLSQAINLSKRNAILVVPFSPSDRQRVGIANLYFKDRPERVQKFFEGLVEATGKQEPRSIAFSSHSGGCYPLSSVLLSAVYASKINELILLDSVYILGNEINPTLDPPGVFARFGSEKGHRVWSTYTEHNAGEGKNAHLMAALDQPRGRCARGKWEGTFLYPTRDDLTRHSCGFVDLGKDGDIHDEHVKPLLGRLLRQSE